MDSEQPYAKPDERYSYRSEIIDRMRREGGLRSGRVEVRLAEKFGFCWGVDRAVAMVWDALRDFPGRRIWLLNQIIHNPKVNEDFQAAGVRFVFGRYAEPGGFDRVGREDVAVIPAFSAEVGHVARLREIGCEIVDTTCPWVEKPHRRVRRYLEDGFTVIVHGIWDHDETRATRSLVESVGGRYVVVRDMEEVDVLCRYLRGDLDAEELHRSIGHRFSPGLDPAVHLQQVGMVNQTTMLARESREVAQLVGEAVRDREEGLAAAAFRDFDTICPATQDNQDAVVALSAEQPPDVFLVVGGYESSNTANLLRAARAAHGAWHIQSAASLSPDNLRHRDPSTGEEAVARNWLPEGEVTVALSAGASTPDTELEAVIHRILAAADAPRPEA